MPRRISSGRHIHDNIHIHIHIHIHYHHPVGGQRLALLTPPDLSD